MTGWNMPPGCNVSDIPGNRPEDGAGEEFEEKFFDKAAEIFGEIDDVKFATLCMGVVTDWFCLPYRVSGWDVG
jgi:hypothetical protein